MDSDFIPYDLKSEANESTPNCTLNHPSLWRPNDIQWSIDTLGNPKEKGNLVNSRASHGAQWAQCSVLRPHKNIPKDKDYMTGTPSSAVGQRGSPGNLRFTSNGKEASGKATSAEIHKSPSPAEQRRMELLKARCMGFDLKEVSSPAQALGQEVINRIENWEICSEKRKRRRAEVEQRRHRQAIRLFVAELVIAGDKEDSDWGYLLLTPGYYSGEAVSYRNVVAIKEALIALGLAETCRGFSSV